MRDGDVGLAALPQVDGRSKARPIVLLRLLPPFGDWLVCGIGTQLQQQAAGFDDLIDASDPDFSGSGLKATSLIRLGFLAVLPATNLLGVIGELAAERHRRLIQSLSDHLRP